MPPLKILIAGGGIAGPALAHFLSRAAPQHRRFEITIAERNPDLRATGAQIDLREQGIEVVRRAGLDAAVRAARVDEEGTCFVGPDGRDVAPGVMATKPGEGRQTFTSEYEIMRGDLVRILADATRGREDVTWIFGKGVEGWVEIDGDDDDDDDGNEKGGGGGGVRVTFTDGSAGTYDLLVGADGQGSRIRQAMRRQNEKHDPPATPTTAASDYRKLGLLVTYFTIPHDKEHDDTKLAHVYMATGGRMAVRRTSSPEHTHVVLMCRGDDASGAQLAGASPEAQKEFWASRFRGAGWQSERFVEGMMRPGAEFYAHELLQVRTPRWSSSSGRRAGRVVLLGDAASCPSAMSGMGTSCALVQAYVLAGELAGAGEGREGLRRALGEYERRARPFVEEIQGSVKGWVIRMIFPQSAWGVALFNWVLWLVTVSGILDFASRFMGDERGGWKLPDYEALKASEEA